MLDNYKGHKVIVFSLDHYNPLNLIRSVGECGISPIYYCIKGKRKLYIADKSEYISKCLYFDSVADAFDHLVREYGSEKNKPFLLFGDDKTIEYFDKHFEDAKGKFYFFNAGKTGRVFEFMDKNAVLEMAKKHGFNALPSKVVKLGELEHGIEYPIITKDINPNSGSWKSDVFICKNEQELIEAYKTITSPTVLIQKFIDKKNEYCLEGFAINGGTQVMVSTSLTYKYLIQGYYSPYQDVLPFDDKRMHKKLVNLFSDIGYEGVFEVEFLIDKNNALWFLEINFRASAFNYTGTVAGMNIPFLWMKSTLERTIDCKSKKEFEPFTAICEPIDYGIRVDKNMVSLADWIKDFKNAKCTYYYNENDMTPFAYALENWGDFK